MKYIIDKNTNKLIKGIAIDNYTTLANEILIDTELEPPNIVNAWDDTEWIEMATEQEIEALEKIKVNEYRHKIYEKTEAFLKSALERALEKQEQGLTFLQLENLKQIYENKKNDAEDILLDLPVNDISLNLLEYEIDRDFGNGKLDATINSVNENYNAGIDTNLSDLKKYASLILFKYRKGNELFETFKSLIENFRSKLLTNLDYKEYSIIDARMNIVNQINSETTIESIMIINNNFNSL